ncbi:DUF3618 domain-containing protein [Actinacidiphila sp. DG2A-62]|uniref:DUF3618 domain-containing protein n=1 Tax=Actinacidiphila sp. DG2A-62 TaxID=3108821 RepID=UPI002DBE8454|nr:DUF3618 domain-containing protein [Actinacidiphila sp. DG2A-62]MEC3995773.1 DUF3618 domain-containing protein [Actinacidiphila sp. DG2A-62]
MTREDPTLAELERQIEQTREELGRTVEELAAKADVPARAKAKATETAERFRESARRVTRHRASSPAAVAGGADREASGGAAAAGVGREASLAAAVDGVAPEESGSHLAQAPLSPAPDPARRAYGAAALALTAATAGAAVWAARRS